MAAAFMGHAATALRRGFLLVGLLAVMAGFLGMHIMTGMHGAHAMTAVTSSAETAGSSSRPETNLAPHPAAHALQERTMGHDSLAPRPATPAGPDLTADSRAAAPSGFVRLPIELRRRCVNALGLCALGGNDVPGRAPTWHGTGLNAQPGHARRRRRQGLLLSPRKSFAGRSVHQPDVRRVSPCRARRPYLPDTLHPVLPAARACHPQACHNAD
ncbi:hypothetical protein NicSoilC12_33340 [Arthrobacter sp. NicSoilC12]|nr:hypothetical protein NicSoilC12_33340 [Arthrobacter sp. NicSoilC12]